MTDQQYTILVAEDEPNIQSLYHDELKDEGYDVLTVGNGYEVLFTLECEKVDLIITDTSMPLMNVFEMINKIQQKYPTLPIMIISGHHNKEELAAKCCNVQAFFNKPVQMTEVKSAIRAILDKKAVIT